MATCQARFPTFVRSAAQLKLDRCAKKFCRFLLPALLRQGHSPLVARYGIVREQIHSLNEFLGRFLPLPLPQQGYAEVVKGSVIAPDAQRLLELGDGFSRSASIVQLH